MADLVRAMEAVRSELIADGLLLERTADEDAVAVDCGSVPMRDTPLCPPTVGNQPLVGAIESWDERSVADLCAVGEVVRACKNKG